MAKEMVVMCDCCGWQMVQLHCKIVCPNCGARWDCSDLTLWLDAEPVWDKLMGEG